jgi:superfamily II DNA or RNA helicase
MCVTEKPGQGCSTLNVVIAPKKKRGFCHCGRTAIIGGMCRIHHYYSKKYLGFSAGGKRRNKVRAILKNIGVLENKHIPNEYKFNSRRNRLLLLAGLIDSDGNASRRGAVEFCNTNYQLASDVCWLARSLGFRASLKPRKASIRSIGYVGLAWRVRISGEISSIPLLLPRKQTGDKTKYASLRYGIKVEAAGSGYYYGFSIDGDRKFLLGDFTVTHNTLMMVKLIGKIKTGPFIFYVLTEDLLDQAYETLSLCLNQPIGRVGAGYFDIQNVTVCMVQTAVLAINRENKGFDLNTYKVEDDSGWEEAKKLVDEKGDAIANLVETAAGIYFDEVHHAACDSAKDVMMASKKAYWRFGGSATPFREDGQEKMIQALFGRKLVEISASWLIQQGWLVRPYILNVHFPDGQAGSWRSWKKIYSECIVNNDELHEFTAKLMKHLRDRGICNLALVREYKHGEALEKLVPGAPFLRGDETKTFRKQTIADLRSGKIPCAIGTTLADEGLDIERLGGIIIASGGKSITKIFQRVGRVLRTFPGKPFGIAIVIHHDGRYLRDHGKKIRRILTSEKQFIIRDVTMANVFEEIDSIIAEHQSTENLLTDETSKPTGESK